MSEKGSMLNEDQPIANGAPSPLASSVMAELKARYPGKFATPKQVFSNIHRGDRIFLGTGCGEPQYLVRALVEYVDQNPKAFFDAEVVHVWSLGIAPYTNKEFEANFRHNSFFIGNGTREAVNQGLADYTPLFLSEVPALFHRDHIPLNVALVQTSLPDAHGYMSLGISVDIVKAAVEKARLVIVQVNSHMPRVHGDGFIHIDEVDYILPFDEPLLEFPSEEEEETAGLIGKYVARLVQDGDTIQVGYGNIPNAVIANLHEKRNLGIHTELISDGLVELIRHGVVNNSQKTLNRGKTIASFSMGSQETYRFLNDNPAIEFRRIDYTNDPLVIAQHDNMTAINSCLQLDLTGQATAESLGRTFFSGIGGQADFMRGAVLAKNGKTILALPSTADGGKVSRIVCTLSEGAGVTLLRGDVHYVVTEYGIAYLHGKNIRERAMELISIAHPRFRKELIQQAKAGNLIFKDQAFIPGKRGYYPEHLETYRNTRSGKEVLLRPVKLSDEPLLKEFFYSLSDQSMFKRFMSTRLDMPHERLQDFVVVDHTQELVLLCVDHRHEKETILGLAQYAIDERNHTAEAAFVVSDRYQNQGIGHELLSYLTQLARKNGLLGFTAEVLVGNAPMVNLFEKMGFDMQKRIEDGIFELKMMFKEA